MLKVNEFYKVGPIILKRRIHPPQSGKAKIKVHLFNLGRYTTSEEMVVEMKKKGYRPSTIRELLTLDAKHPGFELEMVALGTEWGWTDNRRLVPYIDNTVSHKFNKIDTRIDEGYEGDVWFVGTSTVWVNDE